MLREPKYKFDQFVLKVYGYGDHKKIKLIHMNALRTSGVEDDADKGKARGQVNTEKLDESICRTKSKIFELAFCNPWAWFFTGTLDKRRYDRTDLTKWHKDLTKWISNYNRLHGTAIKFLFIPELHKDGKSWHMHGFLDGLPVEHLEQFVIGQKMGGGLAEKVMLGGIVYNWPAYADKFGFCDVEPVKNPEAVSKYMTKYICKDLAQSVTDLNAHMYYHSRGLRFAETIKKGSMSMAVDIEPSYTGDHCTVYWLPFSEDLLEELRAGFA